MFVLLLDKLFDIVDLIFNKGVDIFTVARLFSLFIPTIVPLTLPMAALLACLVTYGRLSEENEITAVRAAGVSLTHVFWLPIAFALFLSFLLVPFNTTIAPMANRAFRGIYEKILQSEPLINVEPRRFFAIKNIKLLAENIHPGTNRMSNVFVYQMNPDGRPADRIFAKTGSLESNRDSLTLRLQSGQLQKYDLSDPSRLTHITFKSYEVNVPLKQDEKKDSLRFRNFSTKDLENLIKDAKMRGLPAGGLEAEYSLRYAIAFAPLALAMIGIPLATTLRRGGRTFGFGITIVVIFMYYLLLIFGLTMAEKSKLPAPLALWIGNATCFVASFILMRRLLKM